MKNTICLTVALLLQCIALLGSENDSVNLRQSSDKVRNSQETLGTSQELIKAKQQVVHVFYASGCLGRKYDPRNEIIPYPYSWDLHHSDCP